MEGQLKSQFKELAKGASDGLSDGLVLLEIREQNAGLIASRDENSNITFEVFELSPPNETTMGTLGRLVRSFPELASSIPLERMRDPDVRHTICSMLAKLSSQAAHGFQPRVRKQNRYILPGPEYHQNTTWCDV